MRARLRRALLGLAGLASACAGFNVGSDEGCVEACATAHACGFLPSGLGYGADSVLAVADCERRCGKSPRDDDDITRILSCLDGTWEAPEELVPWCTDDPDSALVGDLGCATASRCLSGEFPGGRLQGDVQVEVSLISFSDFTTAFTAEALVGLYGPRDRISSCDPALCGMADCADDSDIDHPCDATLCGRARVKTGTICSDLGAGVIELGVDGRYHPPMTQVLLDDDGTQGKECKESARTFVAEEYDLRPGPARAFARVSGRLPASELARVGVTAEDDEEGAAPYCMLLAGMTGTLRAGQNILLVPIGTIDEMAAAKLRPLGCEL